MFSSCQFNEPITVGRVLRITQKYIAVLLNTNLNDIDLYRSLFLRALSGSKIGELIPKFPKNSPFKTFLINDLKKFETADG